ncbi:hypothetical protein THIOM_002238 [Candidatus Thiomargarita nelsonii]|uniref:Uncharacterized protein n=1 Tax=Candidatus Thiomargarita nelsonii TaxID=1003181 RepID=A0A176S243_9GAMM|nr:hypothetical protein THIOM_002238 [Candidatus Thiomargarita nelsonii]
MHSHLITIKIRIKSRTHQRMQLNSLTLNQNRLKSLNPQTMQSRRTIQHHRMLPNHLLQNIPNMTLLNLNHTLSGFNRGHNPFRFQLTKHKRLKQFQGHFLRQATLM